jgi:uncharacterized phage protein gp47/JayE
MPIVNGNYQEMPADEIRGALEAELQNEFGEDIDLTESSVFTTLTSVLAEVISSNQEQSLQEVYQSAFLDTATGVDLDRVVSIIGIQRRAAVHATGVQRFEATGPVVQDYTIRNGTTVQTDGDAPVEFNTTEAVNLRLIDSFEDDSLSEYSGDTGSGNIITDGNAPQGEDVLQLDATDGAHIYNDNFTIQRGTTLHAFVRPNANTVPTITFGIDPLNPQDYYQIAVDEAADEVRLERVSGGSVDSTIDTATGVGLTTGSFHELEWDWSITTNIGVTVYDPDDNELATLGGSDDTHLDGHCGFKSGDANAAKEFDFYTTSAVSANIRAINGGTSGNVGPNSITNMPSPPGGVDTTTNLYPTADTDYIDTNGQNFVIGQEREDDEELRERANNAVTGGGDATHDAIVSELINNTEGVTSVTVYENKTDDDNTGTGGLPPHSFEAVVFGGDDQDVAETIFSKKAITARDYGGVHGTEHSATVVSDTNGQTREITWSRPAALSISLNLDLVIDESYVGDNAVRDDIVQYIGGTLANGSEVVGLGVGEDVRIDTLRDIIVGDENGVIGFDQSVDGTPIETTPTTTTVDGLEVIDVGANEVANADATDASITLNTREV